MRYTHTPIRACTLNHQYSYVLFIGMILLLSAKYNSVVGVWIAKNSFVDRVLISELE